MAVKTIILKPELGMVTGIEEATANAGITPGHIVEFISTGKVQKQAVAALRSPFTVALENSLVGGEIDTDYAADDKVQIATLKSGDWAYCWLSDGENVVIGDELEFGTEDGELKKRSSGISIATAREAVDLSASSNTTKARIKVMVN